MCRDRSLLLLCVAVSTVACAGARAQVWQYTRIGNSTTIVPGTSATFQDFGLPSINGGVVGFAGARTGVPATTGIYTGGGGPLMTIADHNTPIPAGTGNFIGFGAASNIYPLSSGGATIFRGDGSGVSFIQQGIYVRSATGLQAIVDRNTPVPNGSGGNFFGIGQPFIEGGRIVFGGGEIAGGQGGVYSWQGGSLSIIADKTTPIPSGTGTFTGFSDPSLDAGLVVFSGTGANGQDGIYLSDQSAAVQRLYDTNTVVPGGNGGTFIGLGRAEIDAGHIAFYGFGGGQEGVYSNLSGALAPIADHNTPVPGFSGQTFSGFGFVSIDEGVVAFTGLHTIASLGVFSTHAGTLQKVLALGDALDGRIVQEAFIGGQALDGDSIAMKVIFTDGTQGIYMATIPAPATPAVAAPVALAATRRRRQGTPQG